MIIDNHYNYVILNAFKYLYIYESKKSISVETLKLYRSELIKEIIDIYKNGKGHKYLSENDQWHGEISFRKFDEDTSLRDFLEEYKKYFYLENGIVYLYEEVSFDDLNELVRQVRAKENVSLRFDIIGETKMLKDILGISTFYKLIDKYSKIEEKLQNLYYKLFTHEDSKELRIKIKALLFVRLSFFEQLSKLPYYKVEAIKSEIFNYKEENDTVSYDKYPINLKLWKEEFEDPNEIVSYIDEVVYDITQYAIFGKRQNFLYIDKIYEDLENFYTQDDSVESTDEIDLNGDYTDIIETNVLAREQFEETLAELPNNFAIIYDQSDEFWVLYINYLNNLNRFMSIYGESEELLFAKRRLLYALDNPTTMLYDENNFKKAYEETKSMELDEEPFNFFVDEIYFIAQEVFRVQSDEYTIRKLLFVGTYYDLTNDQKLREIIEKFSSDPRFEFFYEIMINNCSDKTPKNPTDDIKKLILKSTDKNKPKN